MKNRPGQGGIYTSSCYEIICMKRCNSRIDGKIIHTINFAVTVNRAAFLHIEKTHSKVFSLKFTKNSLRSCFLPISLNS